MIVNIEYHSGKHRIVPLVEEMQIKEMHVILFQATGETVLELRDKVEKLTIVGV